MNEHASHTTARLVLELLREAHAAEMASALADPRIYEYLDGHPPNLEELAARYR